MGKKLSIDADIFEGLKDIADWEVEPGSGDGLLVNWGNGDTQILAGSTAQIDETFFSISLKGASYANLQVRPQAPSRFAEPDSPWIWTVTAEAIYVAGGQATRIKWRFASENHPDTPYQIGDTRSAVWLKADSGAYLFRQQEPPKCKLFNNLTPVINGWHRFQNPGYSASSSQLTNHPLDYLTGISNNGYLAGATPNCDGESSESHLGWRVTSDTGKTAEREQEQQPTVSSQGTCDLTINYVGGGSTFYGEIPCDANIFLIQDCCEYPKSKQKVNNILAILRAS